MSRLGEGGTAQRVSCFCSNEATCRVPVFCRSTTRPRSHRAQISHESGNTRDTPPWGGTTSTHVNYSDNNMPLPATSNMTSFPYFLSSFNQYPGSLVHTCGN